jgi:hypothetical protein
LPVAALSFLRRVRQADGVGVVERQARLPVPPRPYHRCGTRSGPPRNARVREDRILPHLPALHQLLSGPAGATRRRRTRRGTDARHQASPEDVIQYLGENQITLTYGQATGTLHTGTARTIQTITLEAS